MGDSSMPKARLIAFYLPQFHPIPENDEWWGKGFTEWTNVTKAKPLFRGHYQPRLPADLGYYDLRVPEVRAMQAEMARVHGIEGFCYYHYWFAGRRLLGRPFDEVLESGHPDFPFCLCWANESWTGIWHGAPERVLIEQTYPGWDDHRRHFDFLLRAFSDQRYIRVEGKPLLVIYRWQTIPELPKVMIFWRDLARQAGLPGLHVVGHAWGTGWDPTPHGFDASTLSPLTMICGQPLPRLRQRIRQRMEGQRILAAGLRRLTQKPLHVYSYRDAMRHFIERNVSWEYYPSVLPNWDNTPRSGRAGLVLAGSTPDLFGEHLREGLATVQKYAPEHRILFLKSWNEWAEGNYVEPDQVWGSQYLQIIREQIVS